MSEVRSAFEELLPVAAHWKIIGGLLGISNYVLDQIQHDLVGVRPCLWEMLHIWKKTDTRATWAALANAVEGIDESIAQSIRSRYAY